MDFKDWWGESLLDNALCIVTHHCSRILPNLTICVSLFGWFKFVSFYNTFLCTLSYSRELQNLTGVVRTPEFVASWSEVSVAWGPPNLQLQPKAKAIILKMCPQPVKFGLTLGNLCPRVFLPMSLPVLNYYVNKRCTF